jgi:hypothetical protein
MDKSTDQVGAIEGLLKATRVSQNAKQKHTHIGIDNGLLKSFLNLHGWIRGSKGFPMMRWRPSTGSARKMRRCRYRMIFGLEGWTIGQFASRIKGMITYTKKKW